MSIKEKWDKLPVQQRVEMAHRAGIPGRLGSSLWEELDSQDQDFLVAMEKQDLSDTMAADKAARAASGMTQAAPKTKADKVTETPVSAPQMPKEAPEKPKVSPKSHKKVRTQDYLQWIGAGAYPSIKAFISEAEDLGVSRRISKVPSRLELGKSRIFLAHDEGEKGDAVIFAYYIPNAIEMIVSKDAKESIPEDLKGKITPITLQEAKGEAKRGCGYREDIGAIYLRSYTDEDTIRKLIDQGIGEASIRGGLVLISPMRDYNALIDPEARRFRSIKKVNGNAILKGKKKRAPSLRHKATMPKLKINPGDPWTNEERQLLWDLTKQFTQRQAFREMAKINGRSILAMDYQYRHMVENADDWDHRRFIQEGLDGMTLEE